MTRDQMHNTLRYVREQLADERGSDFSGVEALDIVIAELEQEPSGDLISRQAVLDGIDTYIYKAQSTGTQDDFYSFAELVVKVLPSAKQEPKYCDRNICMKNEYNGIGCDECEVTKSQEPKTGHWIDRWDKLFLCENKNCSLCGHMAQTKHNYCPNCGARMRGENE